MENHSNSKKVYLKLTLRDRNLTSATSKISRRTNFDSYIYVPLFERECQIHWVI